MRHSLNISDDFFFFFLVIYKNISQYPFYFSSISSTKISDDIF